jgi:nitric-oxide synthase
VSLYEDRIAMALTGRLPRRGRARDRTRDFAFADDMALPPVHSCPAAAHPGWAGRAGRLTLVPGSSPADTSARASARNLLTSAERFIAQFYDENDLGSPGHRLRQVRLEIETTGTYWHTADELAFGTRVAWRNSSRCIGRLYWRSLVVRDRRSLSASTDIASEAIAHLREATNGGRIRPMITVFAPDAPGRPGPRILSSQLIRYAGHQTRDGAVTGDPANVSLTRLARSLGWPGGQPPGRFDVLPLIVQEHGAPPTLHEVPADAIREVQIEHPEYRWFAGLGLRWYAVPAISDMYLHVGGIRYPAAPFNGWYMGTEIGSRDLGDSDRYAQLPVIAAHMGLSVASDRTLWKDRALTELNVAVLHSYSKAGVTITDHHTESVRFLRHLQREERHGRVCPADWSWIVPPAASSATPVFHRYYQDFDQTPNFYHWNPARPDATGPARSFAEADASRRPGPAPVTIRRDGSPASAAGGLGRAQQADGLRDAPWVSWKSRHHDL